NVVIEVGLEITVKAGDSFIKIDASGVTITGPQIKLNSGGKPTLGTGASPVLPGLVKQGGDKGPGQLLTQRLGEPGPIVELCQKPENGTPMDCPLADCGWRRALLSRGPV
ncbi:Rhs element Vgr protein, partial [Pseudomonas amygdali pv. mori str. 301020]